MHYLRNISLAYWKSNVTFGWQWCFIWVNWLCTRTPYFEKCYVRKWKPDLCRLGEEVIKNILSTQIFVEWKKIPCLLVTPSDKHSAEIMLFHRPDSQQKPVSSWAICHTVWPYNPNTHERDKIEKEDSMEDSKISKHMLFEELSAKKGFSVWCQGHYYATKDTSTRWRA